MKKWKKAVVHLECATDSVHIYDRIKWIDNLIRKTHEGEISQEEFAKQILAKSRDVRYQGTAIFLIHDERRYLISARHVLWDQDSAKREYQEALDTTQLQQPTPEILRDHYRRDFENKIFSIIFRVPSFDEIMQGSFELGRASLLMNLGAGTSSTVPYSFSKPELDLAIVSLDSRDSRFADDLVSHGYEPVTLNDIDAEPSEEGVEVFTVGYPGSTALLDQIAQTPAEAQWSSSYFSLPVFSFGRVSMLHNTLPFYWIDMSIYPGNSGGPVIEDDKIVGIVSEQAWIPVEESRKYRIRIPFGKIIKAKFIADLVSIQEQKDSYTT